MAPYRLSVEQTSGPGPSRRVPISDMVPLPRERIFDPWYRSNERHQDEGGGRRTKSWEPVPGSIYASQLTDVRSRHVFPSLVWKEFIAGRCIGVLRSLAREACKPGQVSYGSLATHSEALLTYDSRAAGWLGWLRRVNHQNLHTLSCY